MAKRQTAPSLDSLLDNLADLVADKISSRIGGLAKSGGRVAAGAKKAGGRGGRSRRGRTLDMSCRVAGCPNRSGGPRHGFMCEVHAKLPKKEQLAAREAWKAAHKA